MEEREGESGNVDGSINQEWLNVEFHGANSIEEENNEFDLVSSNPGNANFRSPNECGKTSTISLELRRVSCKESPVKSC